MDAAFSGEPSDSAHEERTAYGGGEREWGEGSKGVGGVRRGLGFGFLRRIERTEHEIQCGAFAVPDRIAVVQRRRGIWSRSQRDGVANNLFASSRKRVDSPSLIDHEKV